MLKIFVMLNERGENNENKAKLSGEMDKIKV